MTNEQREEGSNPSRNRRNFAFLGGTISLSSAFNRIANKLKLPPILLTISAAIAVSASFGMMLLWVRNKLRANTIRQEAAPEQRSIENGTSPTDLTSEVAGRFQQPGDIVPIARIADNPGQTPQRPKRQNATTPTP